MLHDRDLSWLGFNSRVLQEAADKSVPLFERIKFLSIFASNLDEFFRVRYPAILAFTKLNKKIRMHAGKELQETILEKVQNEINHHNELYKDILNDILPELKQNGIVLYWNNPLKSEHISEVKEIFLSQVLAFIQPLFLDNDGVEKFLPENNHLYFLVSLKTQDQAALRNAIINIPSDKLPRFFVLSSIDNIQYIIFIDDIIRFNLNCLFPGFEILGTYSIKLNRDAELHLDEEYTGDLLNKMEKQLNKRAYGPPSRFMYEEGMPRNIQLFLAAAFGVKHDEMFSGGRYQNLNDLVNFPVVNKELQYEKWKPISSPNILDCGDIFNVLNQKDILLHLPYESYNPVLSFFNQAAVDAQVTDIYITLYRVAADSHIANALISAAKNGKEVTACIELKARFDEANNIKWSRIMEEAGIRILYSLPKIKVHSKIALIRRHSPQGIMNYGILSTGNFNEQTARFYTDHVLMTADLTITEEMLSLFGFLSKRHKLIAEKPKIKFETLYVSQFNFIPKFNRLIEKEIQKVKAGEEGVINIKVNNLEEQYLIERLYHASKQGVKINLLIRSICCLVPGVPELSENITVKRIVDRYLEHSRIFIFGSNDNCEVIIGSADLMNRNIHSRIEVCVGIKDTVLKKELLQYFNIQWRDTAKAVVLNEHMQQHRLVTEISDKQSPQEAIYKFLQTRK